MPAGTPEPEVDFTRVAAQAGRFQTEIPGAFAGGSYAVWTRACLGETCGTRVEPLRIGA